MRRFVIFCAMIAAFATPRLCNADQYSPPAAYYSGVSGTGATLKTQLGAAMTAGHVQRSYGDFRYSAALSDADPNHPGNILLAYTRESVSAAWDSGSTWNREHVWPVSLQPGSAPSNSTTGNRGDPHALRPADPSTNTSRSNSPYGFADSTGENGYVSGTYYFPGDSDKGDVSRQLFYSDTRYADLGISLVDGNPGSNEMGDLSALLAWHYLDPPDEFDRRRNQVIYSQALNPSYFRWLMDLGTRNLPPSAQETSARAGRFHSPEFLAQSGWESRTRRSSPGGWRN